MSTDKIYYYDAQVHANVYFDSGKVAEGIQSIHNHLDKGYRPIDMHMHILIFASLRKRIMIHGRPAINDHEVELANQTLFDLSRLVNQPAFILGCIPTSERGSSERCTDYDVREYPVYRAANRLIKGAKGGIWDLVIENRSRGNQPQKQDQLSDEIDEDSDDPDPLAINRRGAKRDSTGRLIRVKEEKIPEREGGSCIQRARRSTSSSLTEIEDEDEEEAIKTDAWPLLGWLVDLWTRVQRNSEGLDDDAFLRQLPGHGDGGPRWSIARPMLVVRGAVDSVSGAHESDPFTIGRNMLSLLYNYTRSPSPAIDREAFLSATTRELVDLDITEGKDRMERYLEMLRSATDPEYYQTVLAKALESLISSDKPISSNLNLQDALESLSISRLSENRPRGVSLAAHAEKVTCIMTYFVVSLLSSATPQQFQESTRERRRAAIDKIFNDTRMAGSHNGFPNLARQYAECSLEDYKAVVIAVHNAL